MYPETMFPQSATKPGLLDSNQYYVLALIGLPVIAGMVTGKASVGIVVGVGVWALAAHTFSNIG